MIRSRVTGPTLAFALLGASAALAQYGSSWGDFAPPIPVDLSVLQQAAASAADSHVKVSGDSMVQMTDSEVEVTGHVKASRRGIGLETDRVRYDRVSMRLDSVGNVKVDGRNFQLTCGKLTLHSRQEIGVAWESPRILQLKKDAAGEVSERTEINAVQISFFTNEDRVEGLERVRIYRWMRRNGEMVLDFKISADSLDANMLTGRSVLKGEVQVESPTHRVTANRLVFDQYKGRFTAVGDARVEGLNGSGQVTNVVEGNKLVYFIEQRRTIVSGGVAGVIDPEKQGGGQRVIDVTADQLLEKEIPIIPLSGIGTER